MPRDVVDRPPEQPGIGAPPVSKAYGERENTRLEHVREPQRALQHREFTEAEGEPQGWADARAATTDEGPKASSERAGRPAA